MMIQYCYRVNRGLATMVAIRDGADSRFKKIGQFKTDSDAMSACESHYKKACMIADNFDRARPKKVYI